VSLLAMNKGSRGQGARTLWLGLITVPPLLSCLDERATVFAHAASEQSQGWKLETLADAWIQ
jgi:hypothetical protein